MKRLESQNKRIREHLEDGYSITSLEALEMFGTLRLSGRIHDLRSSGMDIKTERVNKGGKWVAEYSLY